jgi:hypothetical protein
VDRRTLGAGNSSKAEVLISGYSVFSPQYSRQLRDICDDYYVDIPEPRRRDGLVVVVAVLALAVLGTAGTFAYRAMFGGSALPTASAIIETGNWPVSNYGDDQRSDSNQTPIASADASEELVSREEKPLDIQGPPKTAPRVISTIPISPNSSAPSLARISHTIFA